MSAEVSLASRLLRARFAGPRPLCPLPAPMSAEPSDELVEHVAIAISPTWQTMSRNDRQNARITAPAAILAWFTAILIAIALFAVAWHHLLPENFGWLTESQLTSIQTFLFSGAVTGAGGRYLENRLQIRGAAALKHDKNTGKTL